MSEPKIAASSLHAEKDGGERDGISRAEGLASSPPSPVGGEKEASPRLLGPVEIRSLAAAHGIVPTKKLGQNFVHDAGTVRKIVAVAGVKPDETVLEVGPGLGSLTLGLLEAGAWVEAIEIDRGLAAALPATVAMRGADWADRLTVINADAVTLDYGGIPRPPVALVANLPYNVAVPILLTALSQLPSLRRSLVMVQKEVADRLVAAPGNKTYGAPTVKLAWYGEAKRAGTIGPHVFWPKPNVDSALVFVSLYESARGSEELRRQTFSLVDAAFEQRRKMIRASLRNVVSDPILLAEVLERAGVPGDVRPESLTINDFIRIAEALES